MRVGTLDQPPFSGLLPGFPESFLRRYARRLVAAVSPHAHLEFVPRSEAALFHALTEEESLELAVGVLETLPRRREGIRFLPIPGWTISLRALSIGPVVRPTPSPSWMDAVSPPGVHAHEFLVQSGDVAREFLIGQCGAPKVQVSIIEASSVDELVRLIVDASMRQFPRTPLFVSDQGTCYQVCQALHANPGLRSRVCAHLLAGEPEEFPDYRLSMAWRRAHSGRLRYLSDARDEELFGSSYIQTASLYAALIAISYLRSLPDGGSIVPMERRFVRPIPFDLATPAFVRVLCRQLIVTLVEGLTARFAFQGESARPEELQTRALVQIRRGADRLLPKPWQEAFLGELDHLVPVSRVTRRVGSTTRGLAYCHSCSALLDDGIHRGVSDRFCRFCADDAGRLKPRRDVERLLARWIAGWQGGIPEDEAMQRATDFMRAMPAWSEN
jgi:hypothetical protein